MLQTQRKVETLEGLRPKRSPSPGKNVCGLSFVPAPVHMALVLTGSRRMRDVSQLCLNLLFDTTQMTPPSVSDMSCCNLFEQLLVTA